jgi:mono/diheme cytochrome c family protein
MHSAVGTILLLVVAWPSFAADGSAYLREIKPILKDRCVACHGALKQESGLRLDTAAGLLKGGDTGPAVAPGGAESSLLFQRVTAADAAERMPPEGKPLTPQQIATISAWIASGAPAPPDEEPEVDPRLHWAFQPPQRPALRGLGLQAVGSPSRDLRNPIDALLAAEQERHGLKPVGEAPKSLLLRRLYLDLTGLPPGRDELRAFVVDERPDAYERVVDRLLASPQFGERWGRHWMDVWRYSDWFGLGDQLRNSQKHVWHWRDWIVESLNADKGYDRMIVEMLAGDEVAPTDRDTLRATGFLARNYFLFNRTTWLDDTIEHTAKAFLGLTINCAKCHDHKYDPISQLDYYRLRAIFEPHQVRLDAWPGESDLERDGLPRVFDAHLDAPTWLHKRGNEKDPDKSRPIEPGLPASLSAGFVAAPVDLPPEAFNPALAPFVLDDQLLAAGKEIEQKRAALAQAREKLAQAERSVAEPPPAQARVALAVAERALAAAELRPELLRAAHAADVAPYRGTSDEEQTRLVSAAALAARRYESAKAAEVVVIADQRLSSADEKTRPEAEKQLNAAREALVSAERAVTQPGEKYTPLRASLKALEGPDETAESRGAAYPKASTGRRTSLARWIASRENPLTARVAVNQVWMRHFGQPLVESIEDFGRRAPVPPLKNLLDYLAVELMDQGWSLKHLHRLIVTSQAYRLSSSIADADEATLKADPNNVYFWRRRPTRMEAEVVRDSLLSLGGSLDPTKGGPTLDPKQDATVFRRSLYFTHSRDDHNEFLSMFDAADIQRCYRRTESIVPQQALTMANSRLTLAMARKLAERLGQELSSADDQAFVDAAFETVLCRPPDDDERAACLESLAKIKQTLLVQSHPQPDVRAREDLIHALFNHNDFVTVR